MNKSMLTLSVIAVVALGMLAVTPTPAQAQLPPYAVGPTITLPPRLPAYYNGPLLWSPAYPWYPWYGNGNYGYGYGTGYTPYVNLAYYYTHVPSYPLNRYPSTAYGYWYRNAYAPYVGNYFNTPSYYAGY